MAAFDTGNSLELPVSNAAILNCRPQACPTGSLLHSFQPQKMYASWRVVLVLGTPISVEHCPHRNLCHKLRDDSNWILQAKTIDIADPVTGQDGFAIRGGDYPLDGPINCYGQKLSACFKIPHFEGAVG
jgi:hypothetical protein